MSTEPRSRDRLAEESGRRAFPVRGVVALVALAGLALAVSTVLTYRTASRVVEDRLQREALTRARTLAASLSALG
ncbi:MAG: hypothetical protein HYY85_13815, partial [Deltaproteobacteria bacterium]|nr:hypothetical protein [Deltaproteobacteria bacterium]